MRNNLIVILLPLLFFIVALITLNDYGISWDEPIHFHRGQAYFYYFLTGKERFDQDRKDSYFQTNNLPAEYWLEKDDGHPPLNGILASLFNLIFFQKLKLLGDIQAYHLFNITVSTLLVLVVVLFAKKTYGTFASLVSGIVVSTYPLFFAEAHFNIKDPAETAFFTLTIWAFWKSIIEKSPLWLIISAIGFGIAFATKLNILFLPIIVIPYLFLKYFNYIRKGPANILKKIKKIEKRYFISLLVSPIIILFIYFGSWPFLWQDPIQNFIFALKWYQDIGTGQATYGIFLPGGINAFAPLWIFYSTPPYFLLLTFLGVVAAIKNKKDFNFAPTLWLIWFLVPIIRVMVPETTIYGGVRQIMEFLPAMALLAGLGAVTLTNWLTKSILGFTKYRFTIAYLVVLLGFIPHFWIMYKLHPNENVYFNSFIGGLSGAKEKNIPYWGNSFGNAYKQTIDWLNSVSPKNSKIALIQGTSLNIPRIQLRNDIRFSNSFWSGIYRSGEYLIELTHSDKRIYPYAWEYVDTFLDPVFEVKVDGVPIAKVWKNDLDHTKKEFQKKEVIINNQFVKKIEGDEIILDTGREFILTRLVLLYDNESCDRPKAKVFTYNPKGWFEEPDVIPANQLVVREKNEKETEVFFFPGRKTHLVKLKALSMSSCLLTQKVDFILYALED